MLSAMKRVLLFVAIALLAYAADISGKWAFEVETDMGSGSPTFVFKQDGSKLTGTYTGQFGEAPLTGAIQGGKVEFSIEVAPAGEKLTVTYTGTLDGERAMKGTVNFAGQALGKFTAKKQ